MMPSSIAAITVPGRLPRPPSTQIANTRPIYSRPTEGSTGWMMISNAPATAVGAIEMPKAMALIRVREAQEYALDTGRRGAHEPERKLILRHRRDRPSNEGVGQDDLQNAEHGERGQARHQHAQRKIHHAQSPNRSDIT